MYTFTYNPYLKTISTWCLKIIYAIYFSKNLVQYEFERTVSNLICNFVVERLRVFLSPCVLYAPLRIEDYLKCKVLHCYPYCCDSIEPIFLSVRKYCRVCKWWYCLQNLRYLKKQQMNAETIIAFIRAKASIWITLWVLQQ